MVPHHYLLHLPLLNDTTGWPLGVIMRNKDGARICSGSDAKVSDNRGVASNA